MRGVMLACLCLPFMSVQAFSDTPKLEPGPAELTLKAMNACRAEPASLERLDCYDRLLTPTYPDFSSALVKAKVQGEAWQRAFAQEAQRDDHSTQFLTRQIEGERPSVVITTPALGSRSSPAGADVQLYRQHHAYANCAPQAAQWPARYGDDHGKNSRQCPVVPA